MSTSEVEIRNINITMRKSVENLVIPSQDAIGQSISQALTFSGVITQNASQMTPENKSVSRSPSPSLRSSECPSENADNEKTSDTSLNLPQQTGGSDSGSVSSGDVPTVIGPTPANSKNDNSKVTSSNPNPKGVEGGGTVRAKKKSWYNALYPTYKSKSDDFKRIFKDLPDDERLIVDYSCALQKDILAHGRLYASQNYLCFYANIFGWETNLTLRWKDVTAITKEKTALVIPNAILVCSESEKHFLTSISGRDKAYLMLFRIWQNALMDQPTSSQEIWQWVHTCYGEELGLNSDEEGYIRDVPEDSTALPSETLSEDLLDSSSMDASGGADTKEDQKVNRSVSHTSDSSPPLVTNGDAEDNEEVGDTLPTDMSDTSDSEPDKPNNNAEMEKCTEPHDGKLILKQQFPFNIDHVFTMIFTNSRFQLELLAARSATDYVQAPWQVQNGRKCRQINYRLSLSTGPIGPKEVQVTETQVMNKCSKPGVLYSIDCTSENSGIPYADYINVVVHYCLQRVSESATEIALYASIKYKRTMWPVVKSIMEKSTMAGVEEFSRLLATRLAAEADRAAPPARAARRHRRTIASVEESAAAAAAVAGAISPAHTVLAPRMSVSRAAVAPSRSRANMCLSVALVVLVLLNAALYYRLYHSSRHRTLDLDDLHNRMSSVSESQMADWSKLLEQHSVRQRGQLLAWRQALDKTVAHLAQTEQALTKLLETIKPSLESVGHREREREREPEPERTDL